MKSTFRTAQVILEKDETTPKEEEFAALQLHKASALAIKVLQREEKSPVSYQILIESMFGLAQLDPNNSQRFTLKAYTIALQAYEAFPESQLSPLFCYYIAKGMVGSNQKDIRVMPILSDCMIQAALDSRFETTYPLYLRHMQILMETLVKRHNIESLYPRL